MKKLLLKIFLGIISFLGGYVIGLFGLLFLFKLIENIFRIRFEAMWMLIGIIAFLGGIATGTLATIYAVRFISKYVQLNQ